jgi:hypothetical protein
MIARTLARIVVASIAATLAWTSVGLAAGEGSEIAGRWALSHASGARLPLSNCQADAADTFVVDDNGFVWLPPDRRHLPSLVLKITSETTNVLQVADVTGITGTISVSGKLLTQVYSNGVALIFDKCQ